MLQNCDVIAFIPARDQQKAREFYEQTLGLDFISEDAFALVFNAHGVMLRIAIVKDFTPFPFTILGWHVADIDYTVRILAGKGVKFERFSGMQQNDVGIWRSPAGARVAWFKDPDGNVLSITESLSNKAPPI
jgi:catechol 2,3-dioxygenase-like lactoylglutathione lyase family enzyme